MDFACKKVNIEEILKCGFSLTKKELEILKYFLKNSNKEFTTFDLSKKLNLDITTCQKACKKLFKVEILEKSQKNLEKGGYLYYYRIISKSIIRKKVLNIVENWIKKVEDEFCKW